MTALLSLAELLSGVLRCLWVFLVHVTYRRNFFLFLIPFASLGCNSKGIRVAIRRISSRACHSSSSIAIVFLWWSAAHSFTLPWKVARCCPRAVLASAKKASMSFTLASWVAWHIWCWSASSVHSIIAATCSERGFGTRLPCWSVRYGSRFL